MTMPLNGKILGKGKNWDNDPCNIVVDQLYEIRIGKNTQDFVNNFFAEINRETPDENYECISQITLEARWRFDRPDKCLEFLDYWRKGNWQCKIYERRHYGMGADTFEEISENDLEEIIANVRKPVTKLVTSMNQRFNADLGD